MRTYCRRELLAAGMATMCALAGWRAAHAEEGDNGPTVRVRASDTEAETADNVVAVADRPIETPTPSEAPAPKSTAGDVIAVIARSYVGYPYVFGGNSPAGFDCSGFTQFDVLSALGIDIGHNVAGQAGAGYPVEWGAWLPGDIVLFANTYMPGLSHVGIAIGHGADGVGRVVDDLDFLFSARSLGLRPISPVSLSPGDRGGPVLDVETLTPPLPRGEGWLLANECPNVETS